MATDAKRATAHDGFYVLVPRDQEHLNLVLLRKTRHLTQKEKIEGRRNAGTQPPNIEIDPKYAKLMCRECLAIDTNEAFDVGFDGDRVIRMNGDFGFSDDGVFLISGRMLAALRRGKVKGFEVAPVAKDWFAVKITCVVASAPRALKAAGRKCRTCGRPEEMIGGYDRLSQIEPPKLKRTLFTPESSHVRGHRWFRADVPTPVVTGDVVPLLLRSGIKGNACRRLLSDKEWREFLREWKAADVAIQQPGVIVLR